ncbi:MAG: retention module-containing protein, partial [Gammaproteobacteria bacterium]
MSRLVIGTVQGIEGEATVVHADGTVETLQSGARVFADDAISTQQNALVNIEFLDGSILNIGPQYTAVLGKEVFDWTGTVLATQIADAGPGITPAEPITHIGAVVAADGDAMVIRADDRAHALEHGDLLYANDIIKVGSDGHASIMMLDGSFMTFGPESFARLDDDLFPSRYPDYISSGITDAATIRAAILAGQDPADVTRAPAAGATSESEDVGNSFVVLERTGRAVTPESGHETTGPTEAFGEITEELLPPPIGGEPVISIASADGVGATVVEGNTLIFTVELDKPNPVADISATWTLNPGSADSTDFPPDTAFSGVVTIPAGATSATIQIPTLDDALFEGGPGTFEDVSLELSAISNALPGNIFVSGIIEDNDGPPTVTITGDGALADAEADEGTPLVFTLSLSNPSDQTITLDLAATDGSAMSGLDYTNTDFEVFDSGSASWIPAGGTDGTEVSFAPGETTLQVRIFTLDDAIDEPNETLTLGIEGVVAGEVGDTTDTATGTILDNDGPPTVTITGDGALADAEADEGMPLVFTLSLSNPSDQTITLDLAATDGSAMSGLDYT